MRCAEVTFWTFEYSASIIYNYIVLSHFSSLLWPSTLRKSNVREESFSLPPGFQSFMEIKAWKHMSETSHIPVNQEAENGQRAEGDIKLQKPTYHSDPLSPVRLNILKVSESLHQPPDGNWWGHFSFNSQLIWIIDPNDTAGSERWMSSVLFPPIHGIRGYVEVSFV